MKEIKHTLDFESYLKLDRYGSGSLAAMRKGPPALVPWLRKNPIETDATALGTAAHCAILTPEIFLKAYIAKPEGMSFASKEGKLWRDAHSEKKILSHNDSETIKKIVEAFWSKKESCNALSRAAGIEASVLWDCLESGLRSKARPDFFDEESVYDIKISRHALNGSSLAFRAYIEGWMFQLAHNRAGLNECGIKVDRGRLIVLAPKEPHNILVHLLEVKMDALDLLELENIATRKKIFECDRSGEWPGTAESWQPIEPPPGALVESIGGILENMEVIE